MEVTLEAIIAIVALVVALPPTVCIILGWIRRRRRRSTHNRERIPDCELAPIPRSSPIATPMYPHGGRPHHIINATLRFELGDGFGRACRLD
ncbi:hypothetical protein QBC47DRAFT_379178 [Echria macrotheca]|uniref:Uncharacterized protein n=1 Tax=Echria macrotheca TaxID=438768 RepID=A0AAJ0BD93_9PEZI|nr:hypothetical protein QBC47DRAFT_379178 [Echria macrotheca]